MIKQSGEYLGWKIPNNRFRACDGDVLDIQNGRIEKTSEKCREPRGPGPYVLKGTLEFTNSHTGIVRIVGNDGKSIDLYLPPDSKSWSELNQLTKGTPVTVVGPAPGRADTVVMGLVEKPIKPKDLY